jgi:hypothetical protein
MAFSMGRNCLDSLVFGNIVLAGLHTAITLD